LSWYRLFIIFFIISFDIIFFWWTDCI
jgi:hypothetical protein